MKNLCIFLLTGVVAGFAAEPCVLLDKSIAAPGWALLARELLRRTSAAFGLFTGNFPDARGYPRQTPWWGTLDAPVDAIEDFYNRCPPRAQCAGSTAEFYVKLAAGRVTGLRLREAVCE